MHVETYAVESGMVLRVRAVCTGLRHGEDRCPTEFWHTVVPTTDIETLGIERALLTRLADCLQDFPRLSEIMMH